MEKAWIIPGMKELKGLYKEAEGEMALRSYISCLMRLLNGLAQINASSFHKYENIILVKPMELFTEYFIDQVRQLLDTDKNDVEKKEKYIRDLEKAISSVADIYENVINGTANTDKKMFLSMPMNSTLYGISPKLYATYEEIIAQLVDLYEEDETTKYGFLLNPTIRNSLSTETLFKRREKNGKVVIIHMPVRFLEKTEQLPIYLMHEVFHVLTREQRKRKLRAQFLFGNLLNQLGMRIFKGVVFDENERNDSEIKDILFDQWTGSIKKEYLRKVENKVPLDRYFYSENISRCMTELVEKWFQCIENRMVEDILGGIVYKKLWDLTQKQANHKINMEKLIKQIQKLKENVANIQYNNMTEYVLNRLLFLFRESYSDLACLVTSDYDLQQYNNAFKQTIRFRIDDEQLEKDDYHKIRQYFMRVVLKKEDLQSEKECEKSVKYDGNSRKNSERYIIISPYLEQTYVEYLSVCEEELEKSLQSKEKELKTFRKLLEQLQQMNTDFMSKALLGDIKMNEECEAEL